MHSIRTLLIIYAPLLLLAVLVSFAQAKNNQKLNVGEMNDTIPRIHSDSLCEMDTISDFAIVFTDSTVQFQSDQLGYTSEVFETPSFYLEFANIDIDFDGKKEVISYTHPNMNGNQFCEIFDYNTELQKVERKGELVNWMELDSEHKTITTYYGGSWYDPTIYTEYQWINNELTITKELTLKNKYSDYERQNENIMIYAEYDIATQKLQTRIEKDYDSVAYSTLENTFNYTF